MSSPSWKENSFDLARESCWMLLPDANQGIKDQFACFWLAGIEHARSISNLKRPFMRWSWNILLLRKIFARRVSEKDIRTREIRTISRYGSCWLGNSSSIDILDIWLCPSNLSHDPDFEIDSMQTSHRIPWIDISVTPMSFSQTIGHRERSKGQEIGRTFAVPAMNERSIIEIYFDTRWGMILFMHRLQEDLVSIWRTKTR
jgi:hypothetical protein